MAEIQKKKINDNYNVGKSIEKRKSQKQSNSKKAISSETKKNRDKEKINFIARFRIFCNGVKSEFLRVHWPNKNDMIKYSVATVCFIIFCSLFFYCIDVVFAFFQSLFH